jgi:hypothetical protein
MFFVYAIANMGRLMVVTWHDPTSLHIRLVSFMRKCSEG